MNGIIKIKNENLTFDQVCERYDIPASVLAWRLAKNMVATNLIRTPKTLITYRGQIYTPKMLEEISGVHAETISKRYQAGYSDDDLLREIDVQTIKGKVYDRTGVYEKAQARRREAECRAHLLALRTYHPNRDRSRVKTDQMHASADGRLNAARLRNASMRQVRQHNRFV